MRSRLSISGLTNSLAPYGAPSRVCVACNCPTAMPSRSTSPRRAAYCSKVQKYRACGDDTSSVICCCSSRVIRWLMPLIACHCRKASSVGMIGRSCRQQPLISKSNRLKYFMAFLVSKIRPSIIGCTTSTVVPAPNTLQDGRIKGRYHWLPIPDSPLASPEQCRTSA